MELYRFCSKNYFKQSLFSSSIYKNLVFLPYPDRVGHCILDCVQPHHHLGQHRSLFSPAGLNFINLLFDDLTYKLDSRTVNLKQAVKRSSFLVNLSYNLDGDIELQFSYNYVVGGAYIGSLATVTFNAVSVSRFHRSPFGFSQQKHVILRITQLSISIYQINESPKIFSLKVKD